MAPPILLILRSARESASRRTLNANSEMAVRSSQSRCLHALKPPRRLLHLRPGRLDMAPLGGALADRETDGVAAGHLRLGKVAPPVVVEAMKKSLVQAIQLRRVLDAARAIAEAEQRQSRRREQLEIGRRIDPARRLAGKLNMGAPHVLQRGDAIRAND